MKIKSAIFTLSAVFSITPTQAINMSGVVKNSDGIGLAGVAVKLGKADIKTVTGPDGNFTLTDATGLRYQTHRTTPGNDHPFVLKGNRLYFPVMQKTKIMVTAYSCDGRQLLTLSRVISEGNGSMDLPQVGNGVQIYRISFNGHSYTLPFLAIAASNRSPALSRNEPGLAKQTKTTAQLDDALMFIKEGYQYHRIVVKKPDTSNLQITLIPLDTGTITDAEGNVYKTVRIGNQYWTAENWRSTKYTDGSNIGSGCQFYNNTTDAAAKKKWGALYNDAAMKSSKLAPSGWRVPTNADWDTLQRYLISHGYNYDGTISENKIAKSLASVTDWDSVSEEGAIGNDLSLNNASGFTALPAGWRYWNGNKYEKLYSAAYWWSSSGSANVFSLWWINFTLDRHSTIVVLCSVRLVRNK